MKAMATALSLDRYAEVQSELDVGRLRDEVLACAGLSVEEWAAAQREWLDEMARELTLGGFELTNRYTRVFLDRQRSLTAPVSAMPVEAPSAADPTPERAPRPVEVVPFVSVRPSGAASPWAADVAGTFDGVAAVAEPALPFDASAHSPLRVPSVARPARSASDLGGTLDATVAPPGPPLPFGAAPDPSSPSGLSLEQYASLCVEVAVEPAQAGDVLLRYGLTSELQRALDGHWQRRIAAEPTVWMAFNRAYAAYKTWFVASRGK
jgi:hypothetical protein